MEYSHKILATGWVKLGYHSSRGILIKDGNEYPVREEIDLFDLLGLEWIEPKYREIQKCQNSQRYN